MYSVIIVEDDPMVAAINRQYVEMEPAFSVKKEFRTAKEALGLAGAAGEGAGGSDYPGLLYASDDGEGIYRPPAQHGPGARLSSW